MLREPNDITSYAALACIAIQSNQNDQHGGQSHRATSTTAMAEGVTKTFRKPVPASNLAEAVDAADGVVDDARGDRCRT